MPAPDPLAAVNPQTRALYDEWRASVEKAEHVGPPARPDDPRYLQLLQAPGAGLCFRAGRRAVTQRARELSHTAVVKLNTDRTFAAALRTLDSEKWAERASGLSLVASFPRHEAAAPVIRRVLKEDPNPQLR